MFRHIGCGGEVNAAITDDGSLMLLCMSCKRVWSTRLVPMDADPPHAELMGTPFRGFMRQFLSDPDLLLQMGVDEAWLDDSELISTRSS